MFFRDEKCYILIHEVCSLDSLAVLLLQFVHFNFAEPLIVGNKKRRIARLVNGFLLISSCKGSGT